MNDRIVTCVINGKMCRFEGGQTVANVEQQVGVDSAGNLVRTSHSTVQARRDGTKSQLAVSAGESHRQFRGSRNGR